MIIVGGWRRTRRRWWKLQYCWSTFTVDCRQLTVVHHSLDRHDSVIMDTIPQFSMANDDDRWWHIDSICWKSITPPIWAKECTSRDSLNRPDLCGLTTMMGGASFTAILIAWISLSMLSSGALESSETSKSHILVLSHLSDPTFEILSRTILLKSVETLSRPS